MNKQTKTFDPLLFNGLGTKRDRKWNEIIYSSMSIFSTLLWVCGLCIFNGIVVEKWYHHTWFLVFYVLVLSVFLLYCMLWLYTQFSLFRHTRKNKNIDTSNPIVICEHKKGLNSLLFFVISFIAFFVFCLLCFIPAIFIQPFIAPVLFYLYGSKPFLLKRILLFEQYVVLEYRIFGNVVLSRENLVLMWLPRVKNKFMRLIYSNLAFVRPVIDDKCQHIMAYFCIKFNPIQMSNIDKLSKELDSKMGYSAENITAYRFETPITHLKPIGFSCILLYLKGNKYE